LDRVAGVRSVRTDDAETKIDSAVREQSRKRKLFSPCLGGSVVK
jgi:hypothetical protein